MSLDNANVSLSDGFFELMLITMPRDLIQLGEIAQALREQKFDSPLVQFLKVDQVSIYCADKPDWSLDGEKAEGLETNQIGVIPGGVRMFY